MVHVKELTKPDGRSLTLYSRRPIADAIVAPSPGAAPLAADPHLRWHPLRAEWVCYASHRQERTFLPPPEYNPLAPTRDTRAPTELPDADFDVAAFENLFPSLATHVGGAPADLHVPTRPARGACEVIVFSRDPGGSLGALPLAQLELIFDVWADRTARFTLRTELRHVMPFENRGVEMGATLHHPHGQIYAYPFIPPVAARTLKAERRSPGLLARFAEEEERDGRRMLYGGSEALAFVPVCARYPYECWVLPRRPARWLHELTPAARGDFARALKTVLLKLDALWSRPMPYLLVLHQAPLGETGHLRIEITPALRSPSRLKYLAGTELGAGMFANDTLPESTAAELRALEVPLE